jgi:hypothetical protein
MFTKASRLPLLARRRAPRAPGGQSAAVELPDPTRQGAPTDTSKRAAGRFPVAPLDARATSDVTLAAVCAQWLIMWT